MDRTSTPCVVRIGKSGRETHLGEKVEFVGVRGYNAYSRCSTRSNHPSNCSIVGYDLSKITCTRCKPA
jgi:hypothetical protein